MGMKVSIIVPSKGCAYLSFLMRALRDQTIRPSEVILVVKSCDLRSVESLCDKFSLSCVIIEQRKGYVTHALNIGKSEAGGDLILITDEDAIPLKGWVERYIELHTAYPYIAGISSRDIYLDLHELRIIQTPDDMALTRLYRWAVRPWLEPPHPLLKKYRLGVYLTKNLDVKHGPYIPSRTCYSLPFRGVNMSFKANFTHDVWFPEHRLLKRAIGFEQYFGLQLVLKGLETIYIPNNPVLHIARNESLSRTRDKTANIENNLMRALIKDLLKKYGFS
jgi:glycosyltransferase involved in cell wall biosynthesis